MKNSLYHKIFLNTAQSGFREQPPCRHPRSLNPDWSLNPDSFSPKKFPFQKSEASKSRPASKYQFSKYRLCCTYLHLLAAAMNLECSLQVMMGSGRFRRNVLIALVRVFVSTSVGSSKFSLSLFFLSKPSVNSRVTLEVTPTTRYNPWSSRPRLSSVLKHLEILSSQARGQTGHYYGMN